jgi:hypothetical protein
MLWDSGSHKVFRFFFEQFPFAFARESDTARRVGRDRDRRDIYITRHSKAAESPFRSPRSLSKVGNKFPSSGIIRP